MTLMVILHIKIMKSMKLRRNERKKIVIDNLFR